MQGGPTGKLWTLCGDGEALPDSQTDPGVHHLAARCQGQHKEIFLNQRLLIIYFHCNASHVPCTRHAYVYRCPSLKKKKKITLRQRSKVVQYFLER